MEQLLGAALHESEDEIFSTSTEWSSEDDDANDGHQSVVDFINIINAYSDNDFTGHFRLQRETVLMLIERYSESAFIPQQDGGGRMRVGAEIEMYAYVWYISNTCTFRELGNLFGIAKSTAWSVVSRVAKWLVSISHSFIKWPEGNMVNVTAQKFQSHRGIPRVIGAIDCTHVKIRPPTENSEDYFNKKKYYSLVIQAVVDDDKKFIDVFCGEPGSLHDSRVLRRSELFRKARENENQLFPNGTFLIGDSAYSKIIEGVD